MKNTYHIHVRQYHISPRDCNKLVPHWGETFMNLAKAKKRAREIANAIRDTQNNRAICWVEIFKNGVYNGKYAIIK